MERKTSIETILKRVGAKADIELGRRRQRTKRAFLRYLPEMSGRDLDKIEAALENIIGAITYRKV